MRRLTLEEKFWKRVSPEPNTGCWLWAGSCDEYGYGRLDKGMKASRLSYWIATGHPPPPDLQVCHHCDQPACVNPGHLFLGTAFDNMRDMARKGRNRCTRGSAHPRARLSDEQVSEIRRLAAAGWSHRTIANRFPISKSGVSHILSGRCRALGRLP